jgi:hypothetical protein
MILRTDIPGRRWHRRRGAGQILERRHGLMEVHHGDADPGESAPGYVEYHRFRGLCRSFRLEADHGIVDRTQHVALHVVNYSVANAHH